MKKLLALIVLACGAAVAAAAVATPVDTLRYNIVYKWGFIEKTAGAGVVTLKIEGDTLYGTLTGKSIPWGGRLYQVNDTLHTVMTGSDGVYAQHVLYENGWYTKPLVGEDIADIKQNPADYWNIAGQGTLNADAATKEAVTITADMLGFYYLAKVFDFSRMEMGQTLTVPISRDGKPFKKLEVTYNGLTTVEGIDAYDLTFNYTYDGQMSAYPVSAKVSVDGGIPLSIAAELIIGHMEMNYVL